MMLALRPATMDDAAILFAWRNDPLTRQMFINTEPVTWTDHIAWLAARLARDRPELFIAEVASVPVGTVRIDADRLSYTVAPAHRRKGYATAMLRIIVERNGPLRAEINPENVASIKAAEKAGHIVTLLTPSST